MSVLVSPTEPAELRALGVSSPLAERAGADVLWGSSSCGVQRKTLSDLVVSLHDGRLAAELDRMCASLSVRVLVVEGRVRWSTSGTLSTARPTLSRSALRGLLLSVQARGVWVVHTDGLADTVSCVRQLVAWTGKARHSSLDVVPACVDPGAAFLRAVPSIGPAVASAIVSHFGGRVPLQWACSADDLAAVPGVGRVRARRLIEALS